MTKVLLWQAYFRQDKLVFVETKPIFCRDKSMLGATKLLSWQARVCYMFCCAKHTFVATKDGFCHNKRWVLSQQTTFVMTNIIHVAAPSNDKNMVIHHRVTWSPVADGACSDSEPFFKFLFASVLGTQPTVTSRVKLRCSSMEQFVLDSNTTSVYNFTLSSRCACPGLCHHRSEKESELSVGTILVLIFFSALMLYLGVGEFWEWDGELL